MKRLNVFVQRIEDAQASLAASAMTQPAGRDAFEYGRVVGLYAGLDKAKEIVLAILDEEEGVGQQL